MKFLFILILGSSLTAGEPRTIKITCDDLLRFSQTNLKAQVGETLTIVLENVGKIPGLRHNFVLLKPGVNIVSFGNAAQKASDNNYIPPQMADKIVVHTRLVARGEADSVTFSVREKGTYQFICSYPGHQAVSRGTLTVE